MAENELSEMKEDITNIHKWADYIDEELHDDRLDNFDTAIDKIESRLDKIEEKIDSLEKSFKEIEEVIG